MEIKMRQCDYCENTCENPYATPGWIWFTPPAQIRHATGEYKLDIKCFEQLAPIVEVGDFCSLSCFQDFISGVPYKAQPKEKISPQFKELIKNCGELIEGLEKYGYGHKCNWNLSLSEEET